MLTHVHHPDNIVYLISLRYVSSALVHIIPQIGHAIVIFILLWLERVSQSVVSRLPLARDHKLFLVWVKVCVNAALNSLDWQIKPENDGRLVAEEPNDVDGWIVALFLEHELVTRDVPIAAWLAQRSLKDHLTGACPDLKQELEVSVVHPDGLILDLDQHWAELSIFVVLARREHFVQLVERHFEHDLFHELFRGLELVRRFLQTVLCMLLLHLLDSDALLVKVYLRVQNI